MWKKAGGRVIAGLVNRRETERNQFNGSSLRDRARKGGWPAEMGAGPDLTECAGDFPVRGDDRHAGLCTWKILNDEALLTRLMSTYEEFGNQQTGCLMRHAKQRGGPEFLVHRHRLCLHRDGSLDSMWCWTSSRPTRRSPAIVPRRSFLLGTCLFAAMLATVTIRIKFTPDQCAVHETARHRYRWHLPASKAKKKVVKR